MHGASRAVDGTKSPSPNGALGNGANASFDALCCALDCALAE
jgi:hypothetical protein